MSKSQWGQDVFISNYFSNKREGVFVDVGAHDGITGSNTYMLEKEYGWNGVCIEPIDEVYQKLKSSRSCATLNCCVYDTDGEVEFIQNEGYTEMLSGIQSTMSSKHLRRIITEKAVMGGSSKILKKRCRTLTSILTELDMLNVDYLSIDTEGSEYQILTGIDFDKVNVKCITVENNYPEDFEKINTLLLSKKFVRKCKLGGDEVFIKNESDVK